MSMDFDTDNEAISSGFSSVSSLVEETQSKTSKIDEAEIMIHDVPDLTWKAIYEVKIAKLESELADCKKQLEFERSGSKRHLKELEILFTNQAKQIEKLQIENTKYKEELRETLQQLGEMEFKVLKKVNEKKSAISFKQVYSSQVPLHQSDECHTLTTSPNTTHTYRQRNTSRTSECPASNEQMVESPETLASPAPDNKNEENIRSVAISPKSRASRDLPSGNAPHQQPQHHFDTAAGTISPPIDQYRNMLLALSNLMRFSADVSKLKDWAIQSFSINVTSHKAMDVLFDLDEEEVISASNLNQLRGFFETIVRFDLVHTIDQFLDGNYDILEKYSASQ